MTCIAAVGEAEQVFMGGDSMLAAGWDARISAMPKVFRNGPLLIGVAGSLRMLQLLQYKLVMMC